jgi:tetratricopeptide (TPR) repeat protein
MRCTGSDTCIIGAAGSRRRCKPIAAVPTALPAFGLVFHAMRPEEALAAYDRALRPAPENARLLTNRSVARRRLNRPHEALMSASRALASSPDFAEARFAESVARLTLGDFSAGWRGYEVRWSVGFLAAQRRNFTAPLWLGREPLDGKDILLHAEQGLGDTIEFVRYVPLPRRRGVKTIILEAHPELTRLLSRIPDIDVVVAR